MEKKKCKGCNRELLLNEENFYKHKGISTGFNSRCKSCIIEINKKNYKENREKKLQYQKDRYYENTDKLIEYQKKYNKIYQPQYYQGEGKITREKRRQKRLKNDPIYKVREIARRAVRRAFINQSYSKNTQTYKIVGCDWETLKKHIEDQFQEGMTWENHGIYGWHLDHIVPTSSAKTEEDVIRLNHYTNFQPLWAADNLEKSNKIDEVYGNI